MRTGNDYDLTTILGPPWARLVGIEKDDDASGGDDDTSGDDQTGDDADGDADGDDTDGGGDGDDDKITLTRAELDAKIERRLARERRRASRQNDDSGKGDGKGKGDDTPPPKDEDPVAAIARRLDAMDERDRQREEARATERLNDRAAEIAKDSGVRPDRVRAAVRQAELDGLRANDTDDIADAIDDVLKMFPEWKAEKGKGRARTSTRDDTSNNGSGPKQWTDKEIAKLSDKEYDKHAEEIEKALAEGRVKRTA